MFLVCTSKPSWAGEPPGFFSVVPISMVLATGLLLFKRRSEAALWAEEG